MMTLIRSVLALLLAALSWSASAQAIIVNEFFRNGNLSTTDEWIEVVLRQDLTAAQLETYLVGDSQAATSSKLGAYRFANMATIAASFRAGTIIVISGATGPAADASYDPDNDDWNLTLPTNGANITVVTAGGDLAGTDVVWVDTVATGATIAPDGFCVNYDSTPGAFGAVCQVTIGVPGNGTGAVLTGDVTTEPAMVAAWTVGVAPASLTPGQPNGGTNTESIDILRGPVIPVVTIADASILEGNPPGATTLTFTATITPVIQEDCVFGIETIDGGAFTATGGVDYVENFTIPVTIPADSATATFDITIVRDTDIESDETFGVSAYGEPFECDIFSAEATGTILNDDAVVPNITVNDVSLSEGNAGSNNATVTVSLDAPAPAGGVSVDYSTADISATVADNDYANTVGTLNIAAGALTGVIIVPINGDLVFESDETFAVNLGAATGAVVADNQSVVTIVNDDGFPSVSIDSVSQNEGNSGSSDFTFTLTLSNPSSQAIDYLVYTAGVSATPGSDYTEINQPGTLVSFVPLSTSQALAVSVNGDNLVEPNESFEVRVTAAGNRGVGGVLATGIGTIVNDDVAIDISIDDVTVVEGTGAGSTNAVFTVSLSSEPLAGLPVTVDYATASGSAISGTDFTATSGQLSFVNGGALSQTVSVPVTRDDIDENDEGFVVDLGNAVNASLADAQGAGQILDDDAAPTPTVDSISVLEGNAGPVSAVFTVSLSNPSAFALDFLAYTADGTAVAPADYTAIDQGAPVSVSFAPLATSATVTVPVNGDLTVEADETFTLNLIANNNRGQPMIIASGTGTITNDDSATLTLTGGAIAEGNSGTSLLTFTATLSNPVQDPVSVDYASADGTATLADNDYQQASGTLNFASLVTSQQLAVAVVGDVEVEPDQSFAVNLSNLSGPASVSIGTGSAQGTILNDDATSFSIANASITEGTGSNSTLSFTVTLSAPAKDPVSVQFATADGSATAPADYVAANGTLTFSGGQTSQTVAVTVIGDNLVEPSENLQVVLSNPVGGSIATGTATGTILNDDSASLTIDDVAQYEGLTSRGAGALTPFMFTISSSNPSTSAISVNFQTADGTATAPTDYVAGSGTVTIPAGATSATVLISVIPDTMVEPDETFSVNLSAAVGASIADAQGIGTILGDDQPNPVPVNDPRALLLLIALMLSLAGLSLARRR